MEDANSHQRHEFLQKCLVLNRTLTVENPAFSLISSI